VFAVPAFFLFLYIEYQIAKKQKRVEIFSYESSISNISVGIAERLLNLFIAGSFYQLFVFLYDNYRLFTIPNHWWVWVLALLVTDFVWYWYHRLGHEVNLFWGAHIVHHQSEEFNFTVAARITTLQALIRNFFWCALPLLGFDPKIVLVILVVHGVYSFFTHTQVIGKLGWLEYIFITPSLHGVHHASDEKYLDKNYGDVFVFWDKLFGTFQKEEEKPTYGLTHPLKSYSFLWQHFHYYFELYQACLETKGFQNKMRIIFGSPALLDQDIRPKIEKKFLPKKNPTFEFKYKAYLNIQLLFAFILMTCISFYFSKMNSIELFLTSAITLITLINIGALLEQRKWIYYLEYSRIYLILAFVFYEYQAPFELYFLPLFLIFALEKIFRIGKWYNSYLLNLK